MDRKRIFITGGILIVFSVLVYLQFRHWRSFDWATFWAETEQVRPWHIAHAVGLIYVAYILRAIRWKIFLRPVRPQASWLQLVPPTLIGFTGLALLGPARRIHPPLSDRPPTEPAGFFPGGSLGGGADLRYWRLCRPHGAGHIPAEFAAVAAAS